MYVRPQFRGSGFAKLILNHLADHARAHGVACCGWRPGFIRRRPSACTKGWASGASRRSARTSPTRSACATRSGSRRTREVPVGDRPIDNGASRRRAPVAVEDFSDPARAGLTGPQGADNPGATSSAARNSRVPGGPVSSSQIGPSPGSTVSRKRRNAQQRRSRSTKVARAPGGRRRGEAERDAVRQPARFLLIPANRRQHARATGRELGLGQRAGDGQLGHRASGLRRRT